MDCGLPASSDQGVLQARTLEWVAISFSKSQRLNMKCQLVSWTLLTNFTEFSNSMMIIIPASQMSNPDSGHHTYSKGLGGNTLGCESVLHYSLKFVFSALTELGFSQVCPQMPSCLTPTAPHGCSSCVRPCLRG